MSAIAWTFELSRAVAEPPGYRGDYGSWSAVVATEAEARARVFAECQQPSDGMVLVVGDLCCVAVDGAVLWEHWGRRDDPPLSLNRVTETNQRSQLAYRALRRRGLAL